MTATRPRGGTNQVRATVWAAAPVVACVMTAALPPFHAHAQDHPGGRFVRTYWYERGPEHGNPKHNSRFRVNAPPAVIGPYSHRSEVRGNGMMQVLMEEELPQLAAAELYLELWGGHPGTAGKRVTINGRTTYPLPSEGAERGHCTHAYPTIPLRTTDLVNGYNALQFACEQGSAFWGHFIVDNAALRAVLPPDHPDVAEARLDGFDASVRAEPAGEGRETLHLQLEVTPRYRGRIASVAFIGRYRGYDENGNGEPDDWHGMTKHREPYAVLGVADGDDAALDWDLSMLPAQEDVAVRAVIRFTDLPPEVVAGGLPGWSYETAALEGLRVPRRAGSRVSIHIAEDMPAPFWSRDSQRKSCTIHIDEDPGRIERAELHVVIWDGGRGEAAEPFTINGHALPVAGEGRHDVLYRVVEVDPAWLRRGANRIEVFSDTEHHGIEVLLPGPALVVRAASE